MPEKKRKTRHAEKPGKKHKRSKSKANSKNDSSSKKWKGPFLPNSLRKELERQNPSLPSDDTEVDSDEGELLGDVYEYEEEAPQEQSGKNRRFDPVDTLEYELPDQYKDENVPSDDDGSDGAGRSDDEAVEEDEDQHTRMLQEITGMPSEVFQGKERNKGDLVVSETHPESEYNPSSDVLEGDGQISIQDLLDPLQGKAGYIPLRNRVSLLERKSMSIQAPLPKAERDKLERKVAYEQSKKDIAKWDPLVKRNREAPTVYFDEDTDLGFSTVGAIASEFEPRTEFEKKIASLVYDDKVLEAHKKDGARLLELNKISIEDEKERRDRMAKMRSLLFRHEMKQKHIKKIKSKTYHQLMKRDRLKVASSLVQMDPEAAKELAMKQEFKRAEERMTLKHKNSSKWAKRILKRGLSTQDEGTRAAIAEQLQQHALLTRKMKSMKDSSSSDDTSDEDDDETNAGLDQDRASNLLEKARQKTLQVLEEDDDIPNSGVFSLPFMARGLKKKREAAVEEARIAFEQYESSSKQMEDLQGAENTKEGALKGRMVFGAVKPQVPKANIVSKSERAYDDSDSDKDIESGENTDLGSHLVNDTQNGVHDGSVHHDSVTHDNSVFKSIDDIIKDPGPKTTYEVAIFADDSWRKTKDSREVNVATIDKQDLSNTTLLKKDLEVSLEASEDSDTESEGQMVDGILSSGPKQSFKLPSQEELIRRAFAGDHVEEDFEKDKQEILNEENPEPEKPNLVPGWGQWTHIQQKKGLPSWMLREHENAKGKREDALKKRKDAHLKNVIISEKLDKKVEKLHTKSLPFPFTSKDVFERSIRMPIGPEYNPATTIGALNRPEVVKKSGINIKPIKFEEMNPHEKADNGKGQKHFSKKRKGSGSGSGSGKKTKNIVKAKSR